MKLISFAVALLFVSADAKRGGRGRRSGKSRKGGISKEDWCIDTSDATAVENLCTLYRPKDSITHTCSGNDGKLTVQAALKENKVRLESISTGLT